MTEQNRGFLKTWKDDRGFGFIKPEDDSEDIFIHISALGERLRKRPQRGDTVLYYTERTEDGKLKAIDASIEYEGGNNIWLWIISLFALAGVGAIIAYFLDYIKV